MEKQYYAILMRRADFNMETINEEELSTLTPQEIEDLATRINCVSSNYKEIYDEFQQIKKDYPALKALAENDAGGTADLDLEMCIVRISVMKDWETFK